MTKISVLDNGDVKAVFTRVISAVLTSTLSGECTFEFSVTSAMAADVYIGFEVQMTGDGLDYRFNIVRISKAISNGMTICTITCEHKSYELNNPEYNLTEFEFEGKPADCLVQLLEGTALVAGSCDVTVPVELKINQECTRRAALMQLIALCGGEIEYTGNEINIRSHRGSDSYLEIMDGKNISDLTLDIDKRSNTFSYGLTLYKKLDFGVGDNVHIVFTPFYLDVFTRIIAMSYSPFNRREISIDVGDYVPSISDNLYKIEKAASEVKGEVSDSTASIKTGTNNDDVAIGDVTEDIFRITYSAVKSTYAAFTGTIKFDVSVEGTIVFILKKDENEVIRYTEQYAVGEYARTYSYPFVSESGQNCISFCVLTTDGAVAKLPKVQSWGYVMGAYLAGDNPWDGYIRFKENIKPFAKTKTGRKSIGSIADTMLCVLPEQHKIRFAQIIPEFAKHLWEHKQIAEQISVVFPNSWSPTITTPPPITAVNTSNRELYLIMRNPVRADEQITAAAFTMIVTVGVTTVEVQPTAVYLGDMHQHGSDVLGSKIYLEFDTSVMRESTQNITILYNSEVGNLRDVLNNVMCENFQTSFI